MTQASVLNLTASLAIVICLILGAAWLLRRAGVLRGTGPHCLKLLDMQGVGNRLFVAVVEVEQTRLLLGISPQQISLLHIMQQPGRPQSYGSCPGDPEPSTPIINKQLRDNQSSGRQPSMAAAPRPGLDINAFPASEPSPLEEH